MMEKMVVIGLIFLIALVIGAVWFAYEKRHAYEVDRDDDITESRFDRWRDEKGVVKF